VNVNELPANMQAKIAIDVDGCWIWTGAKQSRGYGSVGIDSKVRLTHRVAYEALLGPIPDGLTIDHLCMVKLCCNPAHLEVVTRAENGRRYTAAITHCKHGHEFTDENTFMKHGARQCRTCTRAYKRDWDHRQRTAPTPTERVTR